MSENIWTTFRMTLSLLGKLDLMKTVTDRDLKTLNEIFASGSWLKDFYTFYLFFGGSFIQKSKTKEIEYAEFCFL